MCRKCFYGERCLSYSEGLVCGEAQHVWDKPILVIPGNELRMKVKVGDHVIAGNESLKVQVGDPVISGNERLKVQVGDPVISGNERLKVQMGDPVISGNERLKVKVGVIAGN